MKNQSKAILTDQDPWITKAYQKNFRLQSMPFVYGILPLNLEVGLHQFFVINIQIGAGPFLGSLPRVSKIS